MSNTPRRTILALIPARGGSQGIPRKNVRIVAGRPLIQWTISAARECTRLDRIVVSTDDGEVASVARECGAEVPFRRPVELASATATSAEVACHAVHWFEANGGWVPDYLMMLQPTSPLRTAADINGIITMMDTRHADAIVSVGPLEHPPAWIRRIGPGQQLLPWLNGEMPAIRQQSEPLFQLNGALYLIRTDVLRDTKTFYPPNTLAFLMPTERSVDIDTPNDLILAEQLLLRNADANRASDR